MASGSPPPPSTDTLLFVDAARRASRPWTGRILTYAERTLADGMELARWWKSKDRAGDYAERFDVVREYNPGDRSFGFFDTAVIAGFEPARDGDRAGDVLRPPEDRPPARRPGAAREFVLRYFMRVSHSWQPDAVPAGRREGRRRLLQRAISWLPEEEERHVGFGYRQLYLQAGRDRGAIGQFPDRRAGAIVDLREIGPLYDWIVLEVDMFDFNLSFAPFGPTPA